MYQNTPPYNTFQTPLERIFVPQEIASQMILHWGYCHPKQQILMDKIIQGSWKFKPFQSMSLQQGWTSPHWLSPWSSGIEKGSSPSPTQTAGPNHHKQQNWLKECILLALPYLWAHKGECRVVIHESKNRGPATSTLSNGLGIRP